MVLRLLRFTALALVATSSLALPPAVHTSTKAHAFTSTQKTAIEQIVRNYLIQHPEVLVEASQALQNQQANQQESQSIKAIAANKKALFNDPNTPTAGNPNGDVYLVEFFDYQCGHCRAMSDVIKKVMAQNKNVKVFFKELPIFGGASVYAAQAALAANAQGKYVVLHNAIFSAQDTLTQEKVNQLAQTAGVDVAALTREMQKPVYAAQVRANFALAQKLGIMGTPALVISNKAQTKFQFIPGATSMSNLQAALAAVQN